MPHKGQNKLLDMITEEELRNLLFIEALSLYSIKKKYQIDIGTVTRALDILGIELDKDIWGPTSIEQRKLYLSNAKLTDRQHQILVGNLLGDGRIEPSMKNAKFTFDQCAAHKEYIEWLCTEFQPFSDKVKVSNTFQKSKKILRYGYKFYTTSHPEFLKYRNQFYPDGKKIVPKNISDILTPLGLAMWYMDDGNNGRDARYSILCTNCFTTKDVELLIDVLYNKFNIKSHINYARENEPRIHIGAREGYTRFHEIVDPFVSSFDCFKRKLGREKAPNHNCKLTEEEVREIRNAYKLPNFSVKEYICKMNISESHINNIIHHRVWKHVE